MISDRWNLYPQSLYLKGILAVTGRRIIFKLNAFHWTFFMAKFPVINDHYGQCSLHVSILNAELEVMQLTDTIYTFISQDCNPFAVSFLKQGTQRHPVRVHHVRPLYLIKYHIKHDGKQPGAQIISRGTVLLFYIIFCKLKNY